MARPSGSYRLLGLWLFLPALVGDVYAAEAPFLATGVKVGEVTETSAIVWVRLTAGSGRNQDGRIIGPNTAAKKAKKAKQRRAWARAVLPDGWKVPELQGECPGAAGSARVLYSERKDLVSPSA